MTSTAPQAEMSPWGFANESPAVPATSLTLTAGTTFVICGGDGDIGDGALDGVFVGDTRICDRLVLTVNGERVEALAATQTSPFHAVMVGRTLSSNMLVFREHWVGSGLRSDVRLRNIGGSPRMVTVSFQTGSDLADLFEVKGGRPPAARATTSVDVGLLHLDGSDGRRGTTVRPSPPGLLDADGTITWRVEVPARGEWSGCLEVAAVRSNEELPLSYRCGTSPEAADPSTRQARWQANLPRVTAELPGLADAVARGAYDLGALRIFDSDHPDDPVLAAGAPWFMTLFGRDSLIASWMALVIDPKLALATLLTLARLQGTRTVAATDEQPGRILHEVRLGRSASLALGDGDIYYGSADATPLFVMLVGELHRWGTSLADLKPLLPAVDNALGWIASYGDPDHDGYVEYQRSSPEGLLNQGWKDSWDAISFADGRLAEGPIALAEIQAYTYAAWRAGAELAEAVGDHDIAAHRRQRAEDLRERFNRDFWMDDQDAFALALDGDKRQVNAIASNMGHCLWAGIVSPDRVGAVSRWLVSPELASGWGLRTLATSMARYDPLSYHNGSVWPHDTAIAIAGLRACGRPAEAMRLAQDLLAAASATGGEMPELFSGISRQDAPVPVGYPASCRPQAWASGAPLLVLRSLLGLNPDIPGGRVYLDPVLPAGQGRLNLSCLPLAGHALELEIAGGSTTVRGLPSALTVVDPAGGPPVNRS
jgi:glycogen debranching enzyme